MTSVVTVLGAVVLTSQKEAIPQVSRFDHRQAMHCRMICESMLSTKMQKLLQCTVVLVNETALRALCFFLKQTGI